MLSLYLNKEPSLAIDNKIIEYLRTSEGETEKYLFNRIIKHFERIIAIGMIESNDLYASVGFNLELLDIHDICMNYAKGFKNEIFDKIGLYGKDSIFKDVLIDFQRFFKFRSVNINKTLISLWKILQKVRKFEKIPYHDSSFRIQDFTKDLFLKDLKQN